MIYRITKGVLWWWWWWKRIYAVMVMAGGVSFSFGMSISSCGLIAVYTSHYQLLVETHPVGGSDPMYCFFHVHYVFACIEISSTTSHEHATHVFQPPQPWVIAVFQRSFWEIKSFRCHQDGKCRTVLSATITHGLILPSALVIPIASTD